MNAHTPGPWAYEYDNDDFGERFRLDGPQLSWGWNREGREQAEADARLIAAAPELLAVLMEAVERPMRTEGDVWWSRVSAAIKKAAEA
jgi:hypothetical protein